MKKVLILSIFVLMITTSFAQSIEDINNLIDKSKLAEAKTAIDKFNADTKNSTSSDGAYFKGRIYNSLSRDAATSKADAYNYKIASFDAFSKYLTLDKKELRMKLEQYKSFLDLYLGFYDLGAQQFQEKNYTASYNAFSKAQVVEDFILAKKYIYTEIALSKLDTALVMNTASAALNASDTTNGILNYRKIVDANITSKDYEPVYEFLVSHYKTKKDANNFQLMLNKAKIAYPQNSFWNELELANLSENGDKTAMFAKYEELYTKDPTNFVNSYNYAIELYNTIYVKDYKSVDSATSAKLTTILKSAIVKDTTNSANMLLTNHLYNSAADYSQAASLIKEGKLAKPADLKKKQLLNKLAMAKMDEVIPYAETAISFFGAKTTLKNSQKVNYRLVVGYLAEIYKIKANVAKAAQYEKLLSSIKF